MSTSRPATIPVIEPREAERVATTVARHLPRSLVPEFSPEFTQSQLLFEEFIFRLTVRVVSETGIVPDVGDLGSVDEIVARAGLEPHRSTVPVSWMLHHLARRRVVTGLPTTAGPRFRAERALPVLDPARVLEEQRRHDAACMPAYSLAEAAAQDYPAFLRGARSGEDILLAPARLSLWTGYFSNDNAVYAVNNRVGAAAVEAWMPPGSGTILELGGGLASGTLAVLERLTAAGRLDDIRTFTFTELVSAFLRRAERLLRDRFGDASFLRFAPLDMNRPFAEQDVAPESVSLVYAVNTIHVARDLAFTLGEVRRALAPGGQVIFSECIRPAPGQTLYPEFIFNLLEAFRAPTLHPAYRPNGGFLTPGQWTRALEEAGFVDVRILPDLARIWEDFPIFCVGAIGATRPA